MITPSLRPQHYVGGRTVSWTFSPEVVEVATSVNALPPAISKYIAYDSLTPPNPFIAVTEDGAGEVVYIGGFPRFYNRFAPSGTITDPTLLPTDYKFLHNAIKWTANKEKIDGGNLSVLVIGDGVTSYSVEDRTSSSQGFRLLFDHLESATEFTFTVKNRLNWAGSVIDVSLEELEQYCMVVVIGSENVTPQQAAITERAIVNLTTYRATGSGLVLITDHGPVITDINAANSHGKVGYTSLANRIAVNFGAFFSGSYNRTPVNVGFLRMTYGDHPLYEGMSNSENIDGQGSESEVVVTEIETLDPNAVPDTVMNTPGSYTVNFLIVLTDGSLATRRFTYTIIEGEFVYFTPPNGDPLLDYQHQSPTRTFWLDITVTEDDVGTLVGLLLRNDVPVGRFYHSDGEGTQYQWFSGDQNGVPVASGDIFGVEIQQPFEYYMEVSIDLVDPTIPELQVDLAKTLNGVVGLSVSGSDGRGLLREYQTLIRERLLPKSRQVVNYAESLKALLKHLTSDDPEYPTLEFDIYPNTPSVESALPGLPNGTPSVIAADTGTVWTRHTGEWAVVPQLTPYHYLGRRELIAKESGVRYRVTPEGVVQI